MSEQERPGAIRVERAEHVVFPSPAGGAGAAKAHSAEEPRPDMLEFFLAHYRPGAIALIGGDDAMHMAIRGAQKELTTDGRPSRWSHCFIMGERRTDRRGPNGELTETPYMLESSLDINLLHPRFRNGAQENWLGRWCHKGIVEAGVIDFGLDADQTRMVLATALQLVAEQVLYPIDELIGTWLAIVLHQRWKQNPLDDTHAMYCSSFIRYCYRAADYDFLGQEVDITNTAPEDISRAGEAAGRLVLFTSTANG